MMSVGADTKSGDGKRSAPKKEVKPVQIGDRFPASICGLTPGGLYWAHAPKGSSWAASSAGQLWPGVTILKAGADGVLRVELEALRAVERGVPDSVPLLIDRVGPGTVEDRELYLAAVAAAREIAASEIWHNVVGLVEYLRFFFSLEFYLT